MAHAVNLVNKDQLEILASLRESVNEDKTGLESELEKMRKQLFELGEKNKMQLEQINGLLLEKVNLQSDSIGQREKMLQRERDFGYVDSISARLYRLFLTVADPLPTTATVSCGRPWQAGTCQTISKHRS